MNLSALIDELTNLKEEYGDSEVRFAYQQHYPLYVSVGIVGRPQEPLFLYLPIPDPDIHGDLTPGWYVVSENFPEDEPLNGLEPLANESACETWVANTYQPFLYLGEGSDQGYLDADGRRQLDW